jgi:hypothetical protein
MCLTVDCTKQEHNISIQPFHVHYKLHIASKLGTHCYAARA